MVRLAQHSDGLVWWLPQGYSTAACPEITTYSENHCLGFHKLFLHSFALEMAYPWVLELLDLHKTSPAVTPQEKNCFAEANQGFVFCFFLNCWKIQDSTWKVSMIIWCTSCEMFSPTPGTRRVCDKWQLLLSLLLLSPALTKPLSEIDCLNFKLTSINQINRCLLGAGWLLLIQWIARKSYNNLERDSSQWAR